MTEGVLGEIVRRKRADVAERLAGLSFGDLAGRAEPSRRSLAAVLARPGVRFVMEVKRASPSGGAIRVDADPAAVALAYAAAADAISVLTDAPFFGGSLDDLRAVRRVYDGPILAKDFVVDRRQVAEARLNGADAVLVMLSVLGDREAAIVIEQAERLGMECLVEAHDECEIRRALALRAPIIGINNRNLRTLEVDLALTERLAPLVPADRILVSESGIGSRGDVERLGRHADAFLVGSALMRAESPAAAARALAFGPVKVCGLTDAHDAGMAAASGASYAGLVMVPGTPRALNLRQAEPVAEAAAAAVLKRVGVFRNEKLMQLAQAAAALSLDAVQLHGSEDAEYIRALRGMLAERTEIWAVGAVADEVPAARPGSDRTLYDTSVGGRSGGTGLPFDWSRVKGRPELKRGVLAGGLNPGNARAAAAVGAFALDVGSGVEMAPGRKDAGKVRAFFEALRTHDRRETSEC
jgi:indole-3-glycerol phosphate synthase/phosphoribosylanthranilate isomerase